MAADRDVPVILLTGKNGQVGFELQRALAPLGQVVAVGSADVNLADAVALRELVRRVRPVLIVNPAAYTAVDKAESEPDLAHAVNAVAPGVLGEEAQRLGAAVIHYSTDYVFDGHKPEPYTEDDACAPASVYGASKRAGEQALAAACAQHLILRTSWVVGAHGGNFAKTMLRLAATRDALNVVADQWGAPTSAALIADVTAHLAARWLRLAGAEKAVDIPWGIPWGIYHLVAGGETTWCDYARHVLAAAQAAGVALKAGPDQVHPIATADYPTPAQRPLQSRLDTCRLRETFGLHLPPWQQGVDHILQQILPKGLS
ncbi:dTDP-4-dehydrorhamnose reductase [Amphibiibacter pelophylacis]|uniref:dTDP-4-dehydrorhamnose reductase n=1 Tax=Amphibiibacter pelophylacis TaxID=1799477 RepID=A0ACC6P0V7_9BURK